MLAHEIDTLLKEGKLRSQRWGSWLKFVSWPRAAIIGVSALVSAGAEASRLSSDVLVGEERGTVTLKSDNGKILMSESGSPFRELDLGDTPEAQEFIRLLAGLTPEGAPAKVPVDRRVVADGGVSFPVTSSTKKKAKASPGKT